MSFYDPTSFSGDVAGVARELAKTKKDLDAAFARIRALEAPKPVAYGDSDFSEAFAIDLKDVFDAPGVKYLKIRSGGTVDTSGYADADAPLAVTWSGDGAPDVVVPDGLPAGDDFLAEANTLLLRVTCVEGAGVAVVERLYDSSAS